jgi:hypothetical protein
MGLTTAMAFARSGSLRTLRVWLALLLVFLVLVVSKQVKRRLDERSVPAWISSGQTDAIRGEAGADKGHDVSLHMI